MLSRLCLSPSTNHTLLIGLEELPIVPVLMILPVWFPPNPTVPPSFIVRVRNIDFSPVMFCEQPLSRYYDFSFSFLLSIYASSRISDLGTHIFMGPLGLVLKVLLLFFCALCLKLSGFCSFNTLGLTLYGFESHEATIVFLL